MELAGITPLTNNIAIPPKKTKSEGNLVHICNTNTSNTTNTTNHAAKLSPKNILFINLFYLFDLTAKLIKNVLIRNAYLKRCYLKFNSYFCR